MARTVFRPGLGAALIATTMLAACDESGQPLFELPSAGGDAEVVVAPATVSEPQVVEQDIEKPDVFYASESGLWDGRPSLGGVWVSYPDVPEPERVIIRNATNDRSVIGALFRREREAPGPRIQVSSDAANELGMLAGQPVEVEIVALRREEVVIQPEPVVDTAATAEGTAAAVTAAAVSEQTLDDPIAAAAAAIEDSEAQGGDNAPLVAPGIAAASAAPLTSTDSAAVPATSAQSPLEKPFVQIGIFSVEANANNTAAILRNAGVLPSVLKQSSQGKTFWRVIVGPAMSSNERSQVLAKVKGLGFNDAYFVAN